MTDAQLLELKQGELDAVYEMCTRITEERDAARAERDALRAAGDAMAMVIERYGPSNTLHVADAWWALAGRAEGE